MARANSDIQQVNLVVVAVFFVALATATIKREVA